MASDQRFEDAIGVWLEETAPLRLPGRVLDATFERTRGTRQQGGWRALLGRPQMPRFLPAFGAAALVIAVAVALNVVNVYGPGASPTSSSTKPAASLKDSSPLSAAPNGTFPASIRPPAAGFSRFVSPLQGIGIDYPTGWTVRPGTAQWGIGAVGFSATDNDVIYDPALEGERFIGLASGPLPSTENISWIRTLEVASKMCVASNWDSQDDMGGGAGRYGIFIDGVELPAKGVDGWAGYCHGHGIHDPYNAFVYLVTATRGYVIYLHVGDQSVTLPYGEDWFGKLYKTIDALQ